MTRIKLDDMTEDQKTCYEVLVKTFGGDFRVPPVKAYGTGLHVSIYGGLATWDNSDLTRLVVFAHDYCCRAEIVQSGPGRVGIQVTKRTGREGEIQEIHPEIEEHIAAIRGRKS